MYKSHKWSDALIELTDTNWEGREDKKEVCRSGLETLLGMMFAGTFLLLMGAMMDVGKEVAIYIATWAVLRITSGGKIVNILKDTICFIIVALTVICLGGWIAQIQEIKMVILLFMLMGFAINLMYAGKKVNEKKFWNIRKIETLVVWTLEFIIICNLLNGNPINIEDMYHLFIVASAVCFESVFMIFRQRQLSNEE